MSKFTLEFSTDNAAFDGDSDAEIVRILRNAANRIEMHSLAGTTPVIRDVNGNEIGSFILDDEDRPPKADLVASLADFRRDYRHEEWPDGALLRPMDPDEILAA